MLVTAADALVLLLVEHWVTQIQEHDCHYLVRAWDQKALAVIVSCMPLTSLLLFTGVLVTAADAFVLLLVEQWGVRHVQRRWHPTQRSAQRSCRLSRHLVAAAAAAADAAAVHIQKLGIFSDTSMKFLH